MRPWLVVAVAVCACRSSTPPLYPAGDDNDEGHGLLAQASTQLLTGEEEAAPAFGGSTYGGSAYGGSAYGRYVVPAWQSAAPNRAPRHRQVQGLTGAIEGTIALRSAAGQRCAAAPAALVYIAKVQVGRTLPSDGRPASVGGTIVKRGCSLAPVVQIVTPLPAPLAIHGDAKPGVVRIAGAEHALQAAGRIALPVTTGVTRVELAGGGAAWVVALDTPYYAVTDDQGRFRIDELAFGTYELTIWHPPVAAGEPNVTTRRVRVDAHRAARVDIK